MAFSQGQPRQPKQQQDDFLRVSGMWTSPSGKAITCGLDEQRIVQLMQLAQECLDERVPLRLMVFETREGSKTPYSLNAAKGNTRPANAPPDRPRYAPAPPPRDMNIGDLPGDSGEANVDFNDPNLGPYSDGDPDPAPHMEPVPQPRTPNRSAPRR